MASIKSLGIHEPSALPYLIAESILPLDPPTSSYKWTVYEHYEQKDKPGLEEEVVVAGNCVTWSQGGLVKRVFNLGIENETVLHAFTTIFDVRKPSGSVDPHAASQARALVVILRTQVHIFLLSGETYLFPLSFEVESAFPCSFGFIVQRRIDSNEVGSNGGDHDYSVPHQHDLSTINESFSRITGDSTRPSLAISDVDKSRTNANYKGRLPRTFSLTEILAELGVVVASPSRKAHNLDDCHILPVDETLLYISPSSELQGHGSAAVDLCIALTFNQQSLTFTLWHVRQDPQQSSNRPNKRERPSESQRRKSSHPPQPQSSTISNGFRTSGLFRESFGGPPPRPSEINAFSTSLDGKPSNANDLAAQLGPEFEDVGVQTRSTRRVSSMLARTDLGTGADYSTFNDLAIGHAGRRSMARSVRRAESIGSVSDRQSFGFKPRSSFAPNASFLSTGTSFLDVPGRESFARHDLLLGMDGEDGENRDEPDSDLPRHLGFFKIRSLTPLNSGKLVQREKDWKIVVLRSPHPLSYGQNSVELAVCILERISQEISIVRILVKSHAQSENSASYEVKATEIRHGSSILDISHVQDGDAERLLMLSPSRQGHVLQLESPWSPSYRIDLPAHFVVFNPYNNTQQDTPDKKRETGVNRVVPMIDIAIKSFDQSTARGRQIFKDSYNRAHSISIRLRPRDPFVRKILLVCEYVLGPSQSECLSVAWWEVLKWMKTTTEQDVSEWTALIVVILVLAVPFLNDQGNKSAPAQRRKKGGIVRSGSGVGIDHDVSDILLGRNELCSENTWIDTPAWKWLSAEAESQTTLRSPTRHSRGRSISGMSESEGSTKNPFLLTCISLARDFMQTPTGEHALGPEGYLPTAMSKSREIRSTALARILVGLQLVYEEAKLDILVSGSRTSLAERLLPLMAQLGIWIGWDDWAVNDQSYFHVEMANPGQWAFEVSFVKEFEVPPQPFEPPSIFQHVAESIAGTSSGPFPTLLNIVGSQVPDNDNQNAAVELTPCTWSLLKFLQLSTGDLRVLQTVQNLKTLSVRPDKIDMLPDGLAAVFLQALSSNTGNVLLTSDTLRTSTNHSNGLHQGLGLSASSNHEAIKDFHAMSNNAIETEALQRWDVSSETARHQLTRLLFRDDRRFQEASKLVNQTRPPVVECTPEPDWSESDLLEAQKELAQHVTRRTLAVASGRGMMHFNARFPLLTERVPIPAFSLQCVMQPRNTNDSTPAMTFSADKALFTEDKVSWAFFHNGVSAGLMISKHAQGVDTSWILYNKPPELTNRHAGFLLALGLNGHLKTLARWVAFKYLTPKHKMTSVGLLLGLSVSHLGTMDTLITRLLSVHVTRLLPVGAAELNLSPLTQTTGIMGIGLLYLSSQHRRMSEVMLSEIENGDPEEGAAEDSVLRDEGYRLASGFSLGLINLGQGKHLHGLHDMGILERLLAIAIGTKNVNIVHVLDRATAGAVMATALIFLRTNDHSVAAKIDIPDTLQQFDYVRPDIFLLRTLAKHLIMWDSIEPTMDFVRKSLPSAYRRRADLARTKYLSTEDLPFFNVITGICFAIGLRFAGSQRTDVRDLLTTYLDQFLRLSRLSAHNYDARVTMNSVINNLNVLALSCATVMAGSGDLTILRRLRALHGRTDKDTPFGSHLAAHMALGNLFLAGGTATFGTSNIAVASLCIAFYPIFPHDVLDNRCHLQALRHLWVLAVENRCLVAKDIDTGNIIEGASARIRMQNNTIQAISCPGLLPEYADIKSVEIEAEGYWSIIIDLKDPRAREVTQQNQGIDIGLRRQAAYYKPVDHVFATELEALNEMSGIPSINPNSLANAAFKSGSSAGGNDKIFDWVFDKIDSFKEFDHAERQLVTNLIQNQAMASKNEDKTTERAWLAGNAVDSRLEFERGILPEKGNGDHRGTGHGLPTEASAGMSRHLSRNKIWQLRLLFAWWDRWEREDAELDQHEFEKKMLAMKDHRASRRKDPGVPESPAGVEDSKWTSRTWLRREVVDRLRARVWDMMNEAEGEG